MHKKPEIHKIFMQTKNRFLNMFQIEGTNAKGGNFKYFVASREENLDDYKNSIKNPHPHAVSIYSLYGPKYDKVVLVKQFRYPVGDFVYEFPAGLIENGEDFHETAIREMKEETGLDLDILPVDEIYERGYYQSVGMTNESLAKVYGYASGTPTNEFEEAGEDIEIVLADRDEVRRILKEEKVSAVCAHQLMHFLHNKDPFAFLK